MPKKKPKYPLIGELKLGKSVEDVIKEHFSDYGLTADAREQLPDTIEKIIRINNRNLQFAVRSTWEWSEVFSLNAENEFAWEYWEYSQEGTRVSMDEEAYSDCGILNDIVRRLYGSKKKQPKATLTKEDFANTNGKLCPYCGRNVLAVLDETGHKSITMGCRSCGATWETIYTLSVSGFKEWRHGR